METRTVGKAPRVRYILRDEDIVPSSDESLSDRIKSRSIRFCYVSYYGELDVVLDRNQDSTTNCFLLLDFDYLATPVLRPTVDFPIAKAGDADTRQIIRESTFAVLNTKAHAMVDKIPAGLT